MKKEAWQTKKSCAITWYHELPLQLAAGLITLNNSEHASEKATCPEEGVDYVWLQKVRYLSQKWETGTPEVYSCFWKWLCHLGHVLGLLSHTHKVAIRFHWWLQKLPGNDSLSNKRYQVPAHSNTRWKRLIITIPWKLVQTISQMQDRSVHLVYIVWKHLFNAKHQKDDLRSSIFSKEMENKTRSILLPSYKVLGVLVS